jgi:RNA polymerase sigma-70 factor (ECF subfamily)
LAIADIVLNAELPEALRTDVAGSPGGAAGDELEVAEDAPGEDGREQEMAQYVAPFVARLGSPYREALTLTELQGRTQKQAAEMLGISLSGMKSRVQRGRVQLRAAFEECCSIALDARGKVLSCEPRAGDNPYDGCC